MMLKVVPTRRTDVYRRAERYQRNRQQIQGRSCIFSPFGIRQAIPHAICSSVYTVAIGLVQVVCLCPTLGLVDLTRRPSHEERRSYA